MAWGKKLDVSLQALCHVGSCSEKNVVHLLVMSNIKKYFLVNFYIHKPKFLRVKPRFCLFY